MKKVFALLMPYYIWLCRYKRVVGRELIRNAHFPPINLYSRPRDKAERMKGKPRYISQEWKRGRNGNWKIVFFPSRRYDLNEGNFTVDYIGRLQRHCFREKSARKNLAESSLRQLFRLSFNPWRSNYGYIRALKFNANLLRRRGTRAGSFACLPVRLFIIFRLRCRLISFKDVGGK